MKNILNLISKALFCCASRSSEELLVEVQALSYTQINWAATQDHDLCLQFLKELKTAPHSCFQDCNFMMLLSLGNISRFSKPVLDFIAHLIVENQKLQLKLSSISWIDSSAATTSLELIRSQFISVLSHINVSGWGQITNSFLQLCFNLIETFSSQKARGNEQFVDFVVTCICTAFKNCINVRILILDTLILALSPESLSLTVLLRIFKKIISENANEVIPLTSRLIQLFETMLMLDFRNAKILLESFACLAAVDSNLNDKLLIFLRKGSIQKYTKA